MFLKANIRIRLFGTKLFLVAFALLLIFSFAPKQAMAVAACDLAHSSFAITSANPPASFPATVSISWSAIYCVNEIYVYGWSGPYDDPVSASGSMSKTAYGPESYGFWAKTNDGSGATAFYRTANLLAPATPAPTVSVSVNPNFGSGTTVAAPGTYKVLDWSSTNASSCSGWFSGSATSGSQSAGPINSDTTYTVTCTGTGGSGSASITITVSAPAAPSSLSASASSCGTGTINLSWPSSTGATSYQLYRGGSLIYNGAGTSFSDTGLAVNTNYSYTVYATGSGGQSSGTGSSATSPNTCAVNCVGSWSDTSTCSASCGGGVLLQTYTITTPASGGGTACPYTNGATQWGSTSCNTTACSYSLSISTSGTGTGSAGPAGTYTSGAVVALTNSPSAGSSFSGWSGDADCTDGSVTMNTSKSCIATFTQNTYTLSNSGNFTINKGSGTVVGSNTATRTSGGGTQVPITIAVTGLPSGVTVTSITNNPCTPTVGGCTSNINYSVIPSTVAGAYSITVTGSGSGAPTKQTTFILTIASQATINVSSNVSTSWTINPGNLIGSGTSGTTLVSPGSGTSYTISASGVSNYDGPTYYNQITGYSSTFTLFGGDTANVTLSYTPSFNYSLSSVAPAPVTKGGVNVFTQATINRTLISGSTQSIDINLSGVPAGVTSQISDPICSPSCSNTITFTVSPSAVAGTYPITVTGTPLNKTTSFNLVINNPTNITATCSASPATALVGQGVTWTASNISGGNGVYSTYSWSGVGIQTNPAPATNPFTVKYTTSGTRVATVTITDSIGNIGTCSASGSVLIYVKPIFNEQ